MGDIIDFNKIQERVQKTEVALAMGNLVSKVPYYKKLIDDIKGLRQLLETEETEDRIQPMLVSGLKELEDEFMTLEEHVANTWASVEAIGSSPLALKVRELFVAGDFQSAEALLSPQAIEADADALPERSAQVARLYILKARLKQTDMAGKGRNAAAKKCFQKAVDADPCPDNLFAFAHFLHVTRLEFKAAQELYARALSMYQDLARSNPAKYDPFVERTQIRLDNVLKTISENDEFDEMMDDSFGEDDFDDDLFSDWFQDLVFLAGEDEDGDDDEWP